MVDETALQEVVRILGVFHMEPKSVKDSTRYIKEDSRGPSSGSIIKGFDVLKLDAG